MYCYRCGQRLADGAKRCPNCGAAIFYDENGPVNGTAEKDCDPCADESFGAAYSFHDPNKTTYGDSSDSAYHSDYSNDYSGTEQGSGYQYQYGRNSGYSYGQGSYQSTSGQSGYGGQNPYQQPPTKQDSYALMALILTIGSAVMCCVPYVGLAMAAVGIVFAALGLKSVRRKTMATVALVLGIICLIGNGIMMALTIYYNAHPELIQEWMDQMESLAGGEGITFPMQ